MRKVVRKLIRLVLLAGVVSGLVAGKRAVMGRLSGAPGTSADTRTSSYDSWPPVPRAPGRDTSSA
ncbi:MAG: hypothetical protein ABSH04_08200 [Acidimicrobiales bacterium]|jgi:hypothetical protein